MAGPHSDVQVPFPIAERKRNLVDIVKKSMTFAA